MALSVARGEEAPHTDGPERQLLVGGHAVREGPDALIRTVHPQPRAQPDQLLVAPRVVPVVMRDEDGAENHILLPDDLQQLKGTKAVREGRR